MANGLTLSPTERDHVIGKQTKAKPQLVCRVYKFCTKMRTDLSDRCTARCYINIERQIVKIPGNAPPGKLRLIKSLL